jgi:AraC-like DNA-binding protein
MIESIELFKYSYTSEIIHQNQLNNLNPKINQSKHYIQKWHLGGVDIKITEKELLITFEILPQSLEIDFIDQELKIGYYYLIPKDHVYKLSLNKHCRYYCFEINAKLNSDKYKLILNKIEYQKRKILLTNENTFFDIEIEKKENSSKEIINNWLNEILNYNATIIKTSRALENELCLNLGNKFVYYIYKDHCNLKKTISYYATKLYCSERTLQRACMMCFNVKPTIIVKHHLFINCLKALLDRNESIEKIAIKMGYANQNSFSRFIKSHSKKSPNEIRKLLLGAHDNLIQQMSEKDINVAK